MREGIFCMDIIQLNLSVPSKVNYKHKKRGLLQPPENSYNKVKSEMQGFFIIEPESIFLASLEIEHPL